jgi:ribonuclease I
MALTVHPAFCADRPLREPECETDRHRSLVIHGLWPERDEPRTYPHDCPAPPLASTPRWRSSSRTSCRRWPCGSTSTSGANTAAAAGSTTIEYFDDALRWRAAWTPCSRQANYPRRPGNERAELREVADRFHPGSALHSRSIAARCATRRLRIGASRTSSKCGSAWTTMVRSARQAPARLRAVKRRDTGCGTSFQIAEARR